LLYLAQEELDPLEMVEAINVLDRLPKEFFEKIVCFIGIKTMERSKRSFG
jgi:hypothetical protein